MVKLPEEPDLQLVADWLAEKGLTPSRFSKEETQIGKTPDYRVYLADELVAYCEVKSPYDPYLDDRLDAANDFELVGGVRTNSPMHARIARLLNAANKQFTAVNPTREKLNLLAYVNHDEFADDEDLTEVLTGYWRTGDGEMVPTALGIANKVVGQSKRRIDVYMWFQDGKLQRMVFNQDDSPRHLAVCKLLRIDPARIQQP